MGFDNNPRRINGSELTENYGLNHGNLDSHLIRSEFAKKGTDHIAAKMYHLVLYE